MKLFLLRHAECETGKNRSLSALTEDGAASIRQVADFIKEKNLIQVEEIRHSPWVRARQTAEHFNQMVGINAILREVPLLEPVADFRILADLITSTNENIMLVGHQPNLGMLASYLLSQESTLNLINLKKAGLLCMERVERATIRNTLRNAWQVRWMISPRILNAT